MQARNFKIFGQIGYGSAELGVSAIESFLRLYLLIYLTNSIGLSADLAGYAVSIGILWDAFADPIMGKVSDKTRSRWGPRLPWILIGTPILAFVFVLMFNLKAFGVPEDAWLIFWEVTLLNILLNTAMTMVSVPHLALGNEITENTATARTEIYAWRAAMTLFGFLLGILIPSVTNVLGIKLMNPQITFATIIAFISIGASAITFISCRNVAEKQLNASSQSTIKIKDTLKGPVGFLMIAFFIATFAQGLNSVLAMYYYRFSLGFDDQDIGKILIVFVGSLCITIPFWVMASSRYPKIKLIGYGTAALGVISSILYPIFPKNILDGPLIMAVIGGVLLGTSGLLESLLVDTAENQNIKADAMGLVFGVWKFMAKSARGISIAIGGKLLTLVGYTPQEAPSNAVLQGISWLFGPGVGIFFFLTGILLISRRDMMSPHKH